MNCHVDCSHCAGWYAPNGAPVAARFYAVTFPDSKVTDVHEAPGDYPGGKKGDVQTVEFTVVGIPCLGLNGGPAFKHNEAFTIQIATDTSGRDGPILGRDRRQWRHVKRLRLVQVPLGSLLAVYPVRSDRFACRWWR